MKKYFISKQSIGVCILSSVFIIPLFVTAISFWFSGRDKDWFNLTIATTGLVSLIIIFFRFPSGRFQMSSEGIHMYIGFKTYFFRWDEANFATFFASQADQIGARAIASTYWVVFSRDIYMPKKSDLFLGIHHLPYVRKRLGDLICFQYRKELSPYIIEHLPERAREEYIFQEKMMLDGMSMLDKFYNK